MFQSMSLGKIPRIAVFFVFFFWSLAATAQNTITFLGKDSGIIDHRVGQTTLSYLLRQYEYACGVNALAQMTNPVHAAKKRKYVAQCLDQAIKIMHRYRFINNTELKTFLQILASWRNPVTPPPPPPQPLVSSLGGRITSPDGARIAGVTVTANTSSGAVSAVSGADGSYTLQLAASTQYVLQFKLAGFADQVRLVKSAASSGSISVDVTLLKRLSAGSFNAAAGATLRGAEGTSVTVAANAFVDANGNQVTGTIDASLTPVDVSRPAVLAVFPGEFSGIAEGNTAASPIISLGTAEFEFTQNGQALQLANGASAEILIPIYQSQYQNGTAIKAGDSIPLWWLDESTGIWKQEGTGIVVASTESPTKLAFKASVSHFSWWNCDVTMDAAKVRITVRGDSSGFAVIKATTSANLGWRPNTVETVATIGVQTEPLFIPSNVNVCFTADITYLTSAKTQTSEQCIQSVQSNGDYVLVLESPQAGPLDIAVLGSTLADSARTTGYINFPVERLKLRPKTLETAVTYNLIGGSFPAGVTLQALDSTQAEIVGVPTQAGEFTAVIQGRAGDEVDTASITFVINDTLQAPILPADMFTIAPTTIRLNSLGGPVEKWELLMDQAPIPSTYKLDAQTGLLTLTLPPNTQSINTWCGIVKASNAAGASHMKLCVQARPIIAQ